MSERAGRGTMRIVSGAQTARVVVETGQTGRALMPDSRAMALEAARTEGYQAGRRDAEAEAREARTRLERAIRRLREDLPVAWQKQLDERDAAWRATAVELAFQLAECVLREPLQSPAAVRSALREALTLPLGADEVELRCHPDDAALLESGPQSSGSRCLRIVADAQLRRGDACLATLENGDLDGSIAGRLLVLREHLAAAGNPAAVMRPGPPAGEAP